MKHLFPLFFTLILLSSCPSASQTTQQQGGNTGSPGTLIITEVGSMYYGDVPAWIELYNNSSSVANLQDYTLKSMAINLPLSSYYFNHSFTMPDVTVQPGAYIIVKGRPDSTWPANSSQVVYISDGNYAPYLRDHGYFELVRNGQTADFVRFGTNTTSPSTGGWSGGNAPALPNTSSTYGYSIGRNGANLDTDNASDWTLSSVATPDGPNDVTNTNDADLDGIPDTCEIPGSTFAGLPLYDWGARTGRKDIFIHVNYMASSDLGTLPRKEALDKVVAAFALKGIAIHFDIGNLYASGTNTNNHNLDDQNHQVPYSQEIALGVATGKANIYDYKNAYMNMARKQIFHYLIFANRQDTGLSSGIAELPGNDFIVTLGEWGLTNAPASKLNMLINFQASTIMHEFGHNLGLHHGGGDDTNYKPNYYSIMNYMYQLGGLPAIGTNEGDRYYQAHGFYSGAYNSYSTLTNGPTTTTFTMNYSDGIGNNLNENNANETNGLRRTGSTNVDFNGDSVISGSVSYDLNGDGVYNTYNDYNDWGNINLFFQRNWQGDATGVSILDSHIPQVWSFDKVGDDHQPVYKETLSYNDVKKYILGK